MYLLKHVETGTNCAKYQNNRKRKLIASITNTNVINIEWKMENTTIHSYISTLVLVINTV